MALARDGAVEWSHVDSATLDVRTLSPDFIDAYLDAEWPEVAYCVGVFRMEGRGVTLFDRVEGSHFTILGLPLLPLLGALRETGNGGGMTSDRAFAEVIGDPIEHSRSPDHPRNSGSTRSASPPTIAAAGSARTSLPPMSRASAPIPCGAGRT